MDEVVASYVGRVSEALKACAAELPGEVFSALGFFEDAGNGIFAVGLDTLNNSLLQAKRQEREIHRSRAEWARREGWIPYCERWASGWGFPEIRDFNTSFADFSRPHLVRDYVAEWIGNAQATSGYVLYLVLQIIDGLVGRSAFDGLRLASPFRLCFMNMDREGARVLAILNWPPHDGPRV